VGGHGSDTPASNPAPRPTLGRNLSRLLSSAVVDLSYLADPAAAVEDGDEAVGGPGSPTAADGDMSFAPLQKAAAATTAAATTAAEAGPSALFPVKAAYTAEKAVFTLSLLVIVLQAFWLGAAPLTVFRLFTAEAIILLPFRFFTYRRQRAHYYLLDMVRPGDAHF
jgi:hypothetical protein